MSKHHALSSRAELEWVAAGGAQPRPPPVSKAPLLAWRHVSFDNLAFSDTVQRVEYSIKLVDAVGEVLKAQAVAEEAHAQSAVAAASSLATQLGATGQGIGRTIDGAKAKPTSVVDAGLSAFSGLFGASSRTPSPQAGPPSLSDVGNGPSTLFGALRVWSAALSEQAQQRMSTASRLRAEVEQLKRLRVQRNEGVEPQLQRANARMADAMAKARTCEAAQGRLERARRALGEAETTLLAMARAGATPPAQLADANKRQAGCMAELEGAQAAVLGSTEALIGARRRRDEDLTLIARELQRFDDDCQHALVRTITHTAGTSSDDASASLMLSHRLSEAVGTTSLQSDGRTFLYQRRIALLLQEQIARIDAKSGGGAAGPDSPSASMGSTEDYTLIPQPVPVNIAMRHNKDFLEADAVLSPLMATWVVAILEGKGRERWPEEAGGTDGCTDAPLCLSAASSRRGSRAGEAAGEAGAEDARPFPPPAAGEDSGPVFDVLHLLEHAGRIALLKSLNHQRSVNKDVGRAFPRLATVLWLLLDAADAQEDVCCARITMIMAETFYHVTCGSEEGGDADGGEGGTEAGRDANSRDSTGRHKDRRFLQDVLRVHPIWKREGMWEEIFYESVYEVVKASGQAALSHAAAREGSGARGGERGGADGGEPPSAAPAFAGGGRPGTADFNHAYTQTVMSNLAAVAMNMSTFGVSASVAHRTVSGLAKSNGLPPEMVTALLDIARSSDRSR